MSAQSIPDSLRERLELASDEMPPTMCAWCRRVRDDQGQWRDHDELDTSRPADDYTHGICPSCMATIRARQRARRHARYRGSS